MPFLDKYQLLWFSAANTIRNINKSTNNFWPLDIEILATTVVCGIGVKKMLMGNTNIDYFNFYMWGQIAATSKKYAKDLVVFWGVFR